MADEEPSVRDSILNSTKKLLGYDPDYDVYDLEIEMLINATFAKLHQLGVGPSEAAYQITGPDNVWDEFTLGDPNLNAVKTLIFYRAKLSFDPPETSFGITAMEETAKEAEWRLNIYAEGKPYGIT
jgi:hypothetical protein